MAKKKLQAQRERLAAQQDGKCHWCGEKMEPVPLPGTSPHPRACTLDHLVSRLSPERLKPPKGPRHVAACYECNYNRANAEHAALTPEQRRAINAAGGPLKVQKMVAA